MAIDDVGRVINPMVVDGQVHGGIAQGVAQALFEEAVYDEGSNLVNGSLTNYLVPSAAELPSYELDRTETLSTNPLASKGWRQAPSRRLPPSSTPSSTPCLPTA